LRFRPGDAHEFGDIIGAKLRTRSSGRHFHGRPADGTCGDVISNEHAESDASISDPTDPQA
jgi:hypothetical protein